MCYRREKKAFLTTLFKGGKIDFINDPLFKDGATGRAVIYAAALLKHFIRSLAGILKRIYTLIKTIRSVAHLQS